MIGRGGTGRHAGVEDVGGVGSLEENCHGVDEVRSLKLGALLMRLVPPQLQRPVRGSQ
jgi:hypothetical protein